MKFPEFKILISIKSCDEKTAQNYQNCYVAEKHIVSKLSKISSQSLVAQFEDVNKICVKS